MASSEFDEWTVVNSSRVDLPKAWENWSCSIILAETHHTTVDDQTAGKFSKAFVCALIAAVIPAGFNRFGSAHRI